VATNGELGKVLRGIRTAQELTLVNVAGRAGCSTSQLADVETGRRKLLPWLAANLDRVYGTGGAISALLVASTSSHQTQPKHHSWAELAQWPGGELLTVRLSEGGIAVPVSRRDVLITFGLGSLGGPLLDTLDRAFGAVVPTADTVGELERAYRGFLLESRFSTSNELRDAIVGRIVAMDYLRRGAREPQTRTDITRLMARHAEAVSWLYEEAFDPRSSLYWLDRCSDWSQSVGWSNMTAFTYYRRAILASNHNNDGRQAIEQANHALRIPGLLPNVRGSLLDRVSRGYALLGQRDASERAMAAALPLVTTPVDDPDNPALDQTALAGDEVIAVRRSASSVLLGAGESTINALRPRLASVSTAYPRATLACNAWMARAHANVGEPARACELATTALDGMRELPSQEAWRELQRTTVVLNRRWHGRLDVQEVGARVNAAGTAPAT